MLQHDDYENLYHQDTNADYRLTTTMRPLNNTNERFSSANQLAGIFLSICLMGPFFSASLTLDHSPNSVYKET